MTAAEDKIPTVRVPTVQNPAKVSSDPTLFYFAGSCPIEKNAFIKMMRAIGIRVAQKNCPSATMVQYKTESKTFRYSKT